MCLQHGEMMHSLTKLRGPKASRYHYLQVPLEVPFDAQSDSEDNDTLLYQAPSLNEHTISQFLEVDMHDHSPNLDLPRITRLPRKGCKDDKTSRWRGFMKSKAMVCLFVVTACFLVALIATLALLVAGNWKYFSYSSDVSGSTPATFPPTPPLRPGDRPMTVTTPTVEDVTTDILRKKTTLSPDITQPTLATTKQPTDVETKTNPPTVETTKGNQPTPTVTDTHQPTLAATRKNEPTLSTIITKQATTATKANPPTIAATTANQTTPEATNFYPPTLVATENEIPDLNDKSSTPTTENIYDTQHSKTTPTKTLSWERQFMDVGSESAPVMYDLDGDGASEVLVLENFLHKCETRVSALSGTDGTTVWQQLVQFPVSVVRCVVDANGDGTKDCILAGGGFLTVDGVNGHLLWAVDQSLVFPKNNFYYPLWVLDINGDGVDDWIDIHGGGLSSKPAGQNTSLSFLVAVSGRTGEKLMHPIPMPDGHESYSSPVLFAVNGEDQMVIFGSGSETIPGSLWAVELTSLQFRIESHWAEHDTPLEYQVNLNYTSHPCFIDEHDNQANKSLLDDIKFDLHRSQTSVSHFGKKNKCPILGGKKTAIWNDYNVCLYELVRSALKGVVLPPVAVDLTNDGVKDLVVSMFDGRLIALDGRNLTTSLWEHADLGTESHRYMAWVVCKVANRLHYMHSKCE